VLWWRMNFIWMGLVFFRINPLPIMFRIQQSLC